MPISIPNAYIETFEANVRHLAQQKQSKLRMCVTERNEQSKAHNWDRLAASAARLKPNRRASSPAGGSGSGVIDTTDGLDWTRRNTLIQTYDWGEIVASEEALQMLIDPYSSVTENGVMAMKRQVDDIIVAGANDPAGDGQGGTVTFPAGQVIGAGAAVMSYTLCLDALQLFQENDIDEDEEKFLIINPAAQRALLEEEKVTSFDYQMQKALANGYVENMLGFNKIIVSNRLNNHATPPVAGQTYCLAMTRKAVGLHVAGEIRANAAPRPDMSFETQVYLQLDMDAVRVEDEHVVRIHILDA